MFIDKLHKLVAFIDEQASKRGLSAIRLFMFVRDQAFLKLLFFTGTRAHDLSLIKTKEVTRHVQGDFVLVNQTFGKTVRGEQARLLGVKACSDKRGCQVEGLVRYWTSVSMEVDLREGYLFRSTVGHCISPNPFSAAAAGARLKAYLQQLGLDEGETVHSFRAGAAITLAMSGVELEGIMSHGGWRGSTTALHYLQLGRILGHNSPASILAQASEEGTATELAERYRSWGRTEEFASMEEGGSENWEG
ncbi:LOW QUALITY PROTEIN: uncharacterized protein LOC144907792 [Branchiostoma floridae x Branchiostoma belcheri]